MGVSSPEWLTVSQIEQLGGNIQQENLTEIFSPSVHLASFPIGAMIKPRVQWSRKPEYSSLKIGQLQNLKLYIDREVSFQEYQITFMIKMT